MTPSTPRPCLGQAVKPTPGRRYRFSGWVKAPGAGPAKGKSGVLQPIMPLDLPVKVRPWELTVYPRSHIRR